MLQVGYVTELQDVVVFRMQNIVMPVSWLDALSRLKFIDNVESE